MVFVIALPANMTLWSVIARQPATLPDLEVGGSHCDAKIEATIDSPGCSNEVMASSPLDSRLTVLNLLNPEHEDKLGLYRARVNCESELG